MGKRIALAVLLLLVVAGAVLQNIFVSGATESLTDSLKTIKAALEKEDYPAAVAAADKFSEEWEQKKSLFETLFEHKEVDTISASAKSLQSYCHTASKEEALAGISESLFYIEHIKDIDTLTLENVF